MEVLRSSSREDGIMTTNSAVQDEVTAATIAAIERFNVAFNQRDVPAVMAAMTDDCIFESTCPPPDGVRYVGQEAVRAVWEGLFSGSPDVTFEAEELYAVGDRCTVRWLMRYTGDDGSAQHLRGIDAFRVRDGKVSEKLAYVKG
jgi:ketosteroid isomerase-like protein